MNIVIPKDVEFIINTLEARGFEAFVVGGCVRDSLLGKNPEDWDITTNAKPREIKSCFSNNKLVENGEKHGTIGVVVNNLEYEVTTFRVDGEYGDNRHPDSVTFTDEISLDLSRRDFTVNAMAYNKNRGLVDPFNGQRDLSYKALRCVGDSDLRFSEDALRILRALRFASVYNFSIEAATSASLVKNRRLLNNIAPQRIACELNKLICGDNVNFILRRYKDVFAVFIPEIVSTFDFEQNTPHHNKTVWRHTTCAVSNIEPDCLLRIVMLLHDVGKPMALRTDSKGVDHFKGHNHFSAVIAKTVLERLKYPTKFISDAVTLIEYHDVRCNGNRRQIKHILNKIGEENFERLLKIGRADTLAQSRYKREAKLLNLQLTNEAYREIQSNNECYKLCDLAVNGSDLLHLGITRGEHIGYILSELLNEVIDETLENDSVILKKKAQELEKSFGEQI